MSGAWKWLLGLPKDADAHVDSWALRPTALPENLWLLMGLVVLAAALVYLVVRNYRREGPTPGGVKAVLAALRIAVLACLFLIVLQPAVVMRRSETRYSTVAVLLDDTLSMAWADRYGLSAQREALAKLIDVSADRLSGDDRPSRTEIVRRALRREGGVLARLAEDHPLFIYRFGQAAQDRYTEQLAVLDATPRHAAAAQQSSLDGRRALDRLSAQGFRTSLSQALREVLDDLEGRRVAGVLVVSDGRSTGDSAARRLAAAAQMARHRGVPVFTVGVGDPTPPRNIKVVQLRGPGEVRKGSSAAFTAFLTHRHFDGREVTVELYRSRTGSAQWEKADAAEAVTLAAGGPGGSAGAIQEVVLRTEAEEVGTFIYKAVVAPHPDEMIRDDNAARTTVRVTDQKVSVLLVSGDAGWEFQCLRNYLLKHPEHYKVSVWQQNADVRFNQEASTGMKRTALPITRDDLFAYDVVFLYDPRHVSDSVDAQFLALLKDFVGTHHGGLCYIVGNKFTDKNLAGGGPFDELAGLLPVVLSYDEGIGSAGRPPQTAWPLEITPEGRDHPLMQLGDDAGGADGASAWQSMPGVYWAHRVRRLKTLASALAVSGDPSRRMEDDRREPVIATQYYGKGRVLYMGCDATWRWRRVRAGEAYRRFWANAMSFLSAGRLEKKRILITTGGEAFDAGAEIRVRVEAYSRDFTSMEGETFTVHVRREDGAEPVAEHTLRATRPGVFEGTILADRTGAFELYAEPTGQEKDIWVEEDVATRRIEVRLPQAERLRPEADFAALRELAGDPARFLPIHEIEQLAGRVPVDKTTHVRETPHMIWSTMLYLTLIGVGLLAEWTVRKLYNLA